MAAEALEPPRGNRKVRPIRIEGDLAYIPLTRGLEAIIDAVDVPWSIGGIGTPRSNTPDMPMPVGPKGGMESRSAFHFIGH